MSELQPAQLELAMFSSDSVNCERMFILLKHIAPVL
jgi:hypothetical protein